MASQLPESVQQVAEVIGEAAALDLVRRWPRTRANGGSMYRPVVYVPTRLTPNHRLVSILGWDAAEKLSRTFGGEPIFLATCASAIRAERDELIAKALDGSVSSAAVSLLTGVTERRIRQILSRLRAEMAAMGNAPANADDSRIESRANAA